MSSGNVENFSPQIIRLVAKEIGDLQKEPPEGIKIHTNEEDLTDIQATIAGPAGTPYAGGSFKVKLVLSKNFPSEPPKGFFLTRIFHPNVASNGEICVNTLKRDWKSEYGIKHILLTIKCLLIVPNAESALNEEAGKLLLEQYDDYSMRAKLYTEIHARPPKSSRDESSCGMCSDNSATASNSSSGDQATASCDGPQPKKHAGDKKLAEKKKKEKKRTLKRL